MPESVNGGNGNTPKKEMSMEIRLLLAFLLMGVVMFFTPYLFKTTAPAKKGATTQSQTAATPEPAKPDMTPAAAATPAQPAATPTASAPAPIPGATVQQPVPPITIETDFYKVTFSNQGANVRSWLMKRYKGNDNKELELVNTSFTQEYPLSLYFPQQQPTSKVNWTYYKQTPDADNLGVTFEFSDGHTAVRKTFRFEKKSYRANITAEVSLDGKPIPSMLEWRGGFGDLTLGAPAANLRTLVYDATQNKLIQHSPSDAKNGPVTTAGNLAFAGMADTYFAAIFLPGNGTSSQAVTLKDNTRTTLEEKPADFAGVAVTDGDVNHFELYVGPKDLDVLKRINPKLEQVVDFGWFSFLAKPLFLLVNWFNDTFVHNFGWAIVLVTIVINFALFPLRLSNMKSMRKMQALKPQIDTINAKYKGLSMRDPKAADKNQEVMELYKKHGVNPMGGCVPMLIQIPFFIAFYQVFRNSVEMRGAGWLWVSDLSQPEHLPIKMLPIIMIATQFLMQKMTPQANVDPSQQKMMMFMPLIFGFMFYNFPSGLVLYYLTSNLVNMGQQWFFNHTETAQDAARSVEPPKKKNGRK
jgi:YidC/Oxa1 family membrane protein insertase